MKEPGYHTGECDDHVMCSACAEKERMTREELSIIAANRFTSEELSRIEPFEKEGA